MMTAQDIAHWSGNRTDIMQRIAALVAAKSKAERRGALAACFPRSAPADLEDDRRAHYEALIRDVQAVHDSACDSGAGDDIRAELKNWLTALETMRDEATT